MTTPKTYTISSISDLLEVPPDKLRRCLEEIGNVIEFHRAMTQLLQHELRDFNTIYWTDDDSKQIVMKVNEETPNAFQVKLEPNKNRLPPEEKK